MKSMKLITNMQSKYQNFSRNQEGSSTLLLGVIASLKGQSLV